MKLAFRTEAVDAFRCALAVKPSNGWHDYGIILSQRYAEAYATDGYCAVIMPANITVENDDKVWDKSVRTRDVKIPKGASALEFTIEDWAAAEWTPLLADGTPCGFVAPSTTLPPNVRRAIPRDYDVLPLAPAVGYNPATAMQVLKASQTLKKTNYRSDPIRINSSVGFLWRLEGGGEFVLVGLRDESGFGSFWDAIEKLK